MRRPDSRPPSKRALEPLVALALVAVSAVGALALTVPQTVAYARRETTHAVQRTAAAAPAKAVEAAPEWREQNFARMDVIDARTLAVGDLRITLAGLALRADETCPTLDGRAEPCASRGATHLELLTRWRKVTCRYRETTPGAAVGSCRVGEADLAERMLRTRTVRRDDEG